MPAGAPARRQGKERKSLSDIGILNSPGDLAIIVLILGWPLLLAGAAVGGFVGWRIGRTRGRWTGLIVGMVAGLAVAALGFAIWAERIG